MPCLPSIPLRRLAIATVVAGSAGCYDEGLIIQDLVGTVVIPKDAATMDFTREVTDDNGDPVLDPATGDPQEEVVTVTDVRLIGPVFIGLYASVRDDLFSYPYPETGPVSGAAQELGVGDAYPYGGTTLGDFRYACFEFFQCQMVSGRYESFESIISWWRDTVGVPLVDASGEEITSADAFVQTCYQLRRWTSEEEIQLTPTSDRNGDDVIDAGDLDFVEDGDNFVGEFVIPEAEFFEDMTAWAFMERPGPTNLTTGPLSYNTCNPTLGYQEFTYNQNWRAGTQFQDVLNRPAAYTETGDYVSSTGFTWADDPFEPAEIVLDFEVE